MKTIAFLLQKKVVFLAALMAFLLVSSFFFELRPVSKDATVKIFEITAGESFSGIVSRLKNENLIRSVSAFEIYSVITGVARQMKPGVYEIPTNFSAPRIAGVLSGPASEVEVVAQDGVSVYDIDLLLSKNGILPAGVLVSYAEKNDIEGKLFPDTYKFFRHSTVETVVKKFLDNFAAKAEPILLRDPIRYRTNLIIASLVQKEVSDEKDSRIVAGILKKRLADGMKLDVDASICYLKKKLNGQFSCYPLSPDDFKINSSYNTYLNIGLPPGPIGSPNEAMLKAVLNPIPSPYWFYLSDPKTGKTIFSETLDEQNLNRRIYLR